MSLKHSILLSLLLLAAPLEAHAEDVKRACVEASTLGQTNRNAAQLLEAREQFFICSRDACPAVVRDSCNRWLSEVEELTPSIVIRAADAANSDITEGVAAIDGVNYPLDGKIIRLNPGKHVVVVEGQAGARAEKKLLLASGEKSRLVELRLDTGTAPENDKPAGATAQAPVVAVTPAQKERAPSDRKSSTPTGAWVLGGASLVGFGSFALFAVSANGEFGRLKKACSPSCTEDQMKTGRTDALVADISLGLGVAALAGGITWALLANHDSHEPITASRFSIGPTARGGYASFSTSF
jgi:hypothetical protein